MKVQQELGKRRQSQQQNQRQIGRIDESEGDESD